ncbi:hypothetical protein BCV70DRAFT_218598 [Testicularia cyperi]|uniref:RGS domain-containing protein n=1 Tax=Testicularia cyperi TaxID=1882483 RepID=A0A317XJY6_9BASI|nr:hypothetical protein BCV70DRAFT_218598 [Testicularia cyperi]
MSLPRGSPSAAVAGPSQPPSPQKWRSATEHDVYADNRTENIFGWIQPNEWETVAGPNKSNFMRGDCVECNSDDACPVPSSSQQGTFNFQSCGSPNCGYGGQCCEYSRRATRSHGLGLPLAPSHSRSQPPGPSGSHSLAQTQSLSDIVRMEQRSSIGVSLMDIIHGRSCRPISLLDLRAFLHFQRDPTRRMAAYFPASDMESGGLDDLDLNLDLLSNAEPGIDKEKVDRPKLLSDEVDALDFLVAYERYCIKFREQPRSDRLRSPDPQTCKAAVRAYVRRQQKVRTSSELTAVEMLLQGDGDDAGEAVEAPQEIPLELLANLKPTDLGLKPYDQPLRVEFDRLIRRYFCNQRHCITTSSKKGFATRLARKRHSGSSSDTAADADEAQNGELCGEKAMPAELPKMPRLRWMLNVGLISEQTLELAMSEADFSTHPDVLAPLAEMVYAYMSQHVVPYFFISVGRNLSSNTKRGRLTVGIVCTIIALIFSVLLIIEPSPLVPHADGRTGRISRWWRLLTGPVWCAGLGYILAYFTGLCVWLTLRGNREPDEEEEREREEIRSRISSEEALPFDLADLQADADERDADVERDTNKWMAPEIADILTGIAGQKKKDKTAKRKSAVVDTEELSAAEEGRQRNHSHNSHDEQVSEKSPPGEKSMARTVKHAQADVPIVPVDSSTSIVIAGDKKFDALTAPAAVILTAARRPSVIALGLDSHHGSRSTPGRSSRDLNSLARASIEMHARNGSTSVIDSRGMDGASGVAVHSAIRQTRFPMLNFSIGVAKPSPAAELVEDVTNSPVFTRDALLFDPELAGKVANPASPTASFAEGQIVGRPSRSSTVGSASAQGSPPAAMRRKGLPSIASGLRPKLLATDAARRQPSFEEEDGEEVLAADAPEADDDHVAVMMPAWPEPTATNAPASQNGGVSTVGDIAPWSSSAAKKSSDLPAATRALLFSPPSATRSRFSTATGTTAVGSGSNVNKAKYASKRRYSTPHNGSLQERFWKAVQRGTGFAVGTEKVLDSRVRRAQQMKALRIMAINTVATIVVLVIVVAVP